MLRDLGDGVPDEVECTRVRVWAEETLPEINFKLVNSLRKLNLEERPLVTDAPFADSKAFYTRNERTWSTVRMVIPELRLPVMEVAMLGFTSNCGIKICFDRWLQRSCHESHFSLLLEPRREHRLMVITDKSVNSPFNRNVIELEEIVEALRSRFATSLSMGGFLTVNPAEKALRSPAALRH